MKTTPRGPILILEDDAGIRLMLELALAARGLATQSAATIEAAVAAASRDRPSLLLMDVLLFGAASNEIVARPELAGVPVVVMTASDRAAEIAAEVGAASWLSKPFDLDDLYDLADRYA